MEQILIYSMGTIILLLIGLIFYLSSTLSISKQETKQWINMYLNEKQKNELKDY